jgi:holin-like protein
MNALRGFAVLLSAQAAGEVLSLWLKSDWGWTLPGPVLGMLLLCGILQIPLFEHWLSKSLGEASNILLAHLSLLFVPVGVGVVVHLGLLSAYGLKLIVVLVLSTWIGLAVTALVLRSRWPAQASDGSTPLACATSAKGQP